MLSCDSSWPESGAVLHGVGTIVGRDYQLIGPLSLNRDIGSQSENDIGLSRSMQFVKILGLRSLGSHRAELTESHPLGSPSRRRRNGGAVYNTQPI